MTVLPEFRTALVSAVRAALPGLQVLERWPAENEAEIDSVYVERNNRTFEWRSIGRGLPAWRRNRTETLTVELRVRAYREAARQADAAEAAEARMEQLVAAIEDAVVIDPHVAETVSAAQVVAITDQRLEPRQSGWACSCLVVVEATNHPS
jgi:hypothetical protein